VAPKQELANFAGTETMDQQQLTTELDSIDVRKTGYKALFEKVCGVIDRNIPETVPRDRTTKALIAIGAGAYIADIWDPTPIGETFAAACASVATVRGAYLYRREYGPYSQHTSILRL
jgi:hypothetical protein